MVILGPVFEAVDGAIWYNQQFDGLVRWDRATGQKRMWGQTMAFRVLRRFRLSSFKRTLVISGWAQMQVYIGWMVILGKPGRFREKVQEILGTVWTVGEEIRVILR